MIYALLSTVLAASLYVLLMPLWRTRSLDSVVRKKAVGGMLAFMLVGAWGIYGLLGAPRLLPELAKYQAHAASVNKNITAMAQLLQHSPKDMAAWVSLGQSFMAVGQYANASGAFKQAVLLSRGNPLIILAYASALISDAGGQVTDDAKKSLEMVLLQQPGNPEARYLLTVRQLQEGKTEEAMKNMKELYSSLPDNSPMKRMINRQIGRQ